MPKPVPGNNASRSAIIIKTVMSESKKFQFRQVATISVAHFMHDVYSAFLAPILPLLIEKFSLSYSLAGLLSVLQRIPSLFNPFIGILADRIAMRYLVILAPAVTATTMSLIGIAPTITMVSVLLITMGISSAFFHVPAPVMIRKVSGHRIGSGMGWYMFGGEMARTLGPIIILGAVSWWGLEGTYRLIPFGWAVSVLLYFEFRKTRVSRDLKEKEKWTGIRGTLRNHLTLLIAITGFTFFRAVMKSALTYFLPTYMNLKGETLWTGGISLSILELAGAAGTLLIGSFSDKMGRRTSLILLSILSPVFMLLFLFSGQILSFLFLILIGLVLFGSTPIILALIQDQAKERPAFINSIYMTISFFVTSLCVVAVGGLSDWLGMELTFKIAAWISFGAVPFAIYLKERRT